MQLLSRIKWIRPKTNVIIPKDWEMCYDNIFWTFVLTDEMKLQISLRGTRGGDRERLSLNIYTKLWHCIIPVKPAFLKTHKAEGSREKTHMYINITVSLFNVSLVCFPSFSISRFCTPTFKRIKKLSSLHVSTNFPWII